MEKQPCGLSHAAHVQCYVCSQTRLLAAQQHITVLSDAIRVIRPVLGAAEIYAHNVEDLQARDLLRQAVFEYQEWLKAQVVEKMAQKPSGCN